MAAELIYKLRADVKNRILVKLTDFLKLPEVVKEWITLQDANRIITPAPIQMVANVNSKSSPVRMVIALHQPHETTKQSIHDVIYIKHSELKYTGKWNILSRAQTVTTYRYTLVNSHTEKCHYIELITMSTGSNL